MDLPPAMDGWPKRAGLVCADDRDQHEQESERHRPCGDPVGARTDTVRCTGPSSRAPTRDVLGRCGRLDEHEPATGSDFSHPTNGWNGRHMEVGGLPTRCAPLGQASLTGPSALDPLAHVLDFSPPCVSLGCSWHRRDANSAIGGQKEGRCAAPFQFERCSCEPVSVDPNDRRWRPGRRRSLPRPCPGRARPASARGRERALRRSRSTRAPCGLLRLRSALRA